MLKNHYLKELQLSKTCSRGSQGAEVKRIQEWLNLWSLRMPLLPRLKIDGDFGPATQAAVLAFRKATGANPATNSGTVDQQVFSELSAPLKKVFEFNPPGASIRETITDFACQHLLHGAHELGLNEGPWVRSYMSGQEGQSWPWCVGFVQTVFDQAMSFSGKKYTDFMPVTLSCDVLGQHALKQNTLLRNRDLRKSAIEVKPGDVFLIARTSKDWIHTGIIEKVVDKVFYTLEGNTNEAGSREGVSVMRRIRNFHTNSIDVMHFPQLD